MAKETELYIKITNKDALDWLRQLIANTLANPNHPATMLNYENLTHWENALANPHSLCSIAPVPPKPKAQQRVERKKRKPKEQVKDDMFTCAEHPTYGGARRPQKDCKQCWSIYKRLHPLEYQQKRREFERKMKQAAV